MRIRILRKTLGLPDLSSMSLEGESFFTIVYLSCPLEFLFRAGETIDMRPKQQVLIRQTITSNHQTSPTFEKVN